MLKTKMSGFSLGFEQLELSLSTGFVVLSYQRDSQHVFEVLKSRYQMSPPQKLREISRPNHMLSRTHT